MCPPAPATPDLPPDLGVRLTAGGAQFCVYAGHARSVEVCLFDVAADGSETERRVPLRHRAHGTWFDTVPGVAAGQRYALRVDGEWDPDRALLHNSAKLLLETGDHPARLRDMVTSPGGTTIAGLHALESGGLRPALIDAVERATARAHELGAKLTPKG